ncbi:hypothetical protein D9M71_701360 [compost metagenome]
MVLALGVEQIDGERGADAGDQHRLATCSHRQQRQITVHAEAGGVGIGDPHTGVLGFGARHPDLAEARLQYIQHGRGQRRCGDTGNVGGVA